MAMHATYIQRGPSTYLIINNWLRKTPKCLNGSWLQQINVLSLLGFVFLLLLNRHSLIYFQKTLDKLPDKILLHIFSYLRHNELCVIASVCKKWKMLVYDSKLWARVSLRPEYSKLHFGNHVEGILSPGGGSAKNWSSMLEKNSVWNGGSKLEKWCGTVWTQNGRICVIWVCDEK